MGGKWAPKAWGVGAQEPVNLKMPSPAGGISPDEKESSVT